MKMFSKYLTGFIVGSCLATSVFASGAHYANQKSLKNSLNATLFTITINNYTPDSYTIQDVYYPTGYSDAIKIGPPNPNSVYVDVGDTDNQVCISITRDLDNYPVVSNQCFTSAQTISIGPYTTATKKPSVSISH